MTPSEIIYKVLIVDNQLEWHQRLINLLDAKLFSLTCVKNYDEALQQIKSPRIPFHVVITEIRLDIAEELEEGFDLAQKIKDRRESTRVIFLSRYAWNEKAVYVRKALTKLSAHDYLEKNSLNDDEFVDIVREAAEEAERRRNIFVTMPNARKYELFYEQVKNILKEIGLDCQQVDPFQPGLKIEHIVQRIHEAKIVIAILGNDDPNVNFEAGIAHAKGKPVLLLTDNGKNFSKKMLGKFNHIDYKNSAKYPASFSQYLIGAIQNIQEQGYPTDFKEIKTKPNSQLCFVLQPPGNDGKDTFSRIIHPAAISKGVSQIAQLQDIHTSGIHIHTIWERINQADMIITELTGMDTDICHLSGLVYGLEKPGIIITKTGNIPEDFQTANPIVFSKELQANCDKAQQDLADAIHALQLGQSHTPIPENNTSKGLIVKQTVNPPSILELQLSLLDSDRIEIRSLQIPGGGMIRTEVALPFSLPELKAVLKALDVGSYHPDRYKEDYVQSLRQLGLLQANTLHPELHKIVGGRLYHTLFGDGEFLVALKMATKHPPVICKLQFDPEDVIPAQFPWELMHDNTIFLAPAASGLEIIRSIAFGQPIVPIEISLPLKVLYICPRPINEQEIPAFVEKNSLLEGLKPLIEVDQLIWEELSPPTWDALRKCLESTSYHIIHFDGHGSYARMCPNPDCREPHYPSTEKCLKCGLDMSKSSPMGYLHFENNDHYSNHVSVDDLKQIIVNREVQLITLTACSSGVAQGASIFNGVAQGLIQAGIPAIVGMQGSPPVESIAKFVNGMYTALGKGKRISEAVNEARLAIYADQPKCWFMPILYLRSSDQTSGQLFSLQDNNRR